MIFLIGVLMLGLIIFVHELGHFMSAKFFKIPVSEFAVGMGPQILALETDKTNYTMRAIPIGGYVNIEGMEIDSTIEDGFNTKPAYQRLIVLFAGVFMNFLTALLLLFVIVKISGKIEYEKQAYVGSVSKNSLNYSILKEKDKILEIEGVKIDIWEDIPKQISLLNGKENIQVKIERDNKEKILNLKLFKEAETNRYLLGISPVLKRVDLNYVDSFKQAIINFKNIFNDTLKGFSMLFKGKANLKDMSGPVGIFKVIGEMSQFGLLAILNLAVILSINIGILNLLPIPALDGGRIIFVFFEMIGLKMNKKLEEKLHRSGMALLIFLIIFISVNDIWKIFN